MPRLSAGIIYKHVIFLFLSQFSSTMSFLHFYCSSCSTFITRYLWIALGRIMFISRLFLVRMGPQKDPVMCFQTSFLETLAADDRMYTYSSPRDWATFSIIQHDSRFICFAFKSVFIQHSDFFLSKVLDPRSISLFWFRFNSRMSFFFARDLLFLCIHTFDNVRFHASSDKTVFLSLSAHHEDSASSLAYLYATQLRRPINPPLPFRSSWLRSPAPIIYPSLLLFYYQ